MKIKLGLSNGITVGKFGFSGGGGDSERPSVVITSTESNPTQAATIPLTITFSESVTGFVVGDITIFGGTLSNFSGSGSTYTVDITPDAIAITVDIAAGVAQDSAGNTNTAATQFTIASTRGMVAYWKLEEGTTNARIDSVGSNNLTANGTGGVGSETGIVGNAAKFVLASSQYLSVADNDTLSMGDIDFTVAFWCNMDNVSSLKMLVVKIGGGGHFEYRIDYVSTTNRFRFLVSADGTALTSLSADNFGAATQETNYFVCAWHDAAADKIFISINNGTANEAAHAGGVIGNRTAPFNIGGNNNNPNYDGWIDEVGIWKRVLTAAERTYLYNGGSGRTYPFDMAGDAGPNQLIIPLQNRTLVSGAGAVDWVGRAHLCKNGSTWIMSYRVGATHSPTAGGDSAHLRFSTDEGANWTNADTFTDGNPCSGVPITPANGLEEAMVFRSPNGDILLHVRDGDTATLQYRSTDGGKTWTSEGDLNISAGAQQYVVVGSTIYVTTWGSVFADLYKSTNNGTTWSKVSRVTTEAKESGLVNTSVNSFLWIGRDDADEDKTWKAISSDLGINWSAVTDIFSLVGAVHKPILYKMGSRIYMLGRNFHQDTTQQTGLWLSLDDGATWNGPYINVPGYADTGYGDFLEKTNGDLYVVTYGGSGADASILEYTLRPIL